MAFDGVVISCLAKELQSLLAGGRVDKIYMPDRDSIVMAVRSLGKNYRLFLSSNPSMPRISLTEQTREYPQNPPMFCMLLRKHLTGGRILSVSQPDMERIVEFTFESRTELGDLTEKRLIVELMGRHSNIIFVDDKNRISDCTRLVDGSVSSVRTVLPGQEYQSPPPQNKISLLSAEKEQVRQIILSCPKEQKVDKFILESFAGFSPLMAREPIYRAIGNTDAFAGELTIPMLECIAENLWEIFEKIKSENFTPGLILDKSGNPADFAAIEIKQLPFERVESIAAVVESFYLDKELRGRMAQQSGDIMKIVTNLIERCARKAMIQHEDIRKSAKKDKYRLYGDIITANIYKIQKGDRQLVTENFYSENLEEITIPLETELIPSENAQKYYARYNKLKNTEIYATEQLEKSMADIEYLKSVQMSLENCENLKELSEIKSELVSEGYLKRAKASGKQKEKPSSPDKFISSDGFEILVGKNNKQNDHLTLKMASNSDVWFHTKTLPGSHTVIVTGGKPVPDSTMTEAAMLAAYYSKARGSENVPVDYTLIKNVKKPAGAKAGMVIYVDYKTAYVTPDEAKIKELKKI
ncbi:MAG: NFACT family protein [Clostridia bacterium]|nr:NFACT family protein [Clostridia bacterium]